MINLKQYLNSLNEGQLHALSFGDEFESSEEFDMQAISSKHVVDTGLESTVENVYKKIDNNEFTKNDILLAISAYKKLHKTYKFLSNSTNEFKHFIVNILTITNDPTTNLNWISFPNLTELCGVFCMDYDNELVLSTFNGDISEWDVSNITNMQNMFNSSHFNGDLSKWDVSNVELMDYMFTDSKFNNNSICNWNMLNVSSIQSMFEDDKKFNQDLSRWDVSNITDMIDAFRNTKVNFDISNWHPAFAYDNWGCAIDRAFENTPIEQRFKPYISFKRF